MQRVRECGVDNLSLRLLFLFEDVIELVEFIVPLRAELEHPVINFFHFTWVEVIVDFSAGLFLAYEFTLCQNFDVFADGLPAAVEVFGYSVWGHGVERQQAEYCSSGWVCYGLEGVSSHLICNQLIANICATD